MREIMTLVNLLNAIDTIIHGMDSAFLTAEGTWQGEMSVHMKAADFHEAFDKYEIEERADDEFGLNVRHSATINGVEFFCLMWGEKK